MPDALNENNLRDHLMAFADGEMDAAQSAAVWAYLAEHPNGPALQWLADQKRLTLAARRSLDLPAPQDLQDRIAALVTAEALVIHPATTTKAWPRRIGYAVAIAAAVAIAVTATQYATRKSPASSVLPADLVVNVARVHAECSRLPAQLHAATFEETDPRLAGLTKADLSGNNPSSAVSAPDLSSVGFRFIGAGPCPASKFDTVHLLYRSTKPLGLAAVSLFVQIDGGQFPGLAEGHVYRVSSPTSPFPMLAWRSGKVIYFLLADDDRTEANVLQTLHPTATTAIIMVAD